MLPVHSNAGPACLISFVSIKSFCHYFLYSLNTMYILIRFNWLQLKMLFDAHILLLI